MNETPYYYKKWRAALLGNFLFIYKHGFYGSAWSAVRADKDFTSRETQNLPNCPGWVLREDDDSGLYEESKTGALSSFLKLIG